MKWSSPLPRLRVRRWHAHYGWAWGFRLELSASYGSSLRLVLHLGSTILNVYLTWPERSTP